MANVTQGFETDGGEESSDDPEEFEVKNCGQGG